MSATEAVFHYKKKLARHAGDSDPGVILHCLAKLDRVPMTTGILQETGVGRVVNGLKKSADPGSRVSNLARSIVQKWKDIVATEEGDQEEDKGRAEEDEDAAGDDPDVAADLPKNGNPDRATTDADDDGRSGEGRAHRNKHHRKDKKDKSHHSHGHRKGDHRDKVKPLDGGAEEGKSSRKGGGNDKKVVSSSEEGSSSKGQDHRRRRSGNEGHHHQVTKKKSSPSKPVAASNPSGGVGGGEFEEAMLGVDQHHPGSSKKRPRHQEPSAAKGSSAKDPNGLGSSKTSSSKTSSSSSSSSSSKKSQPSTASGTQGKNGLPSDISPNYRSRQEAMPPPTGNGGYLSSSNSNPFSIAAASSQASSSLSSARKTEEEALSALISMSKKSSNRHVIYSGVRRSAFTEVPRLFDICIHTLQEHVDKIDECGNLPFEILEPVLERATPQILMNIERFNLYLVEDTGPLWERHCKKEFPKEDREEFESWREMYERCWQSREEKLTSLKEKMGASYENARNSVRHTKLYAGSSTPRHVRRAQEKNGTGPGWAGPATSLSSSSSPTSNFAGAKRPAGPPSILQRPASEGPGRPVVVPPDKSKKPKIAPMMAKTLKMARGLKYKR